MKILNNILLLVLAICIQTACTKEDLSNCDFRDTTIELSLNVVLDNYDDDEYLPFNRGDIYIFDSEGIFCASHPLTQADDYARLKRGHKVVLENHNLDNGNYKILMWACWADDATTPVAYEHNITDPIAGQTKYEDFRTQLTSSSTRTEITTGPIGYTFVANGQFGYQNSAQAIELRAMLVNNAIDVMATYLTDDAIDETLAQKSEVIIESSDLELTFNGRALSEQSAMKYTPTEVTTPQDGQRLSSFRKNTLDKRNTNPTIYVKKGDKILYSEKLFTLLEGTNYPTQESLDRTHKYDIRIDVRTSTGNSNITVDIWINGWRYIAVEDPV